MFPRPFRRALSSAVAVLIAFAIFQYNRERRSGAPLEHFSAPPLVQGAEPGPRTAEEHFSPSENLEQIDLARLREAQQTIDIAMYAFTDQYLAEALVERARSGVHIRVYRDRSQFDQEERIGDRRKSDSTTDIFRGEANIEVRVKNNHELMHLKSYLIDGKVLRTGSANWSPSGLKRQDNNAHFTSDPRQIRDYQGTFDEMWNRSDNQRVQ